jgi:putative ABC transport system permease protein
MIALLKRWLTKSRAIIGVAFAGLRHDRTRTVLAIVGISLAVLATTTLAGTGFGVIETGEEKFSSSGRDLWVTGGALKFAPGTVGGIENPIVDSHSLAENISSRESVRTAVPLSFQTVYVSANDSSYETLVGVGGPARGGSVNIVAGESFSSRDVHYADGEYTGPMTMEVVIDQRTADMFNVSVGDSLQIGGTIASAREHEFTVVGISPTYSRFLGTPTVIIHLSELQEITGTTGTDSASLITVSLQEGASPEAVASDIERTHPAYQVRTNEEQLRATLERQAVLLASGASLVGLAVVAGIALTVNLMLGIVYQQRREFAALRAIGLSQWTLLWVIGVQALVLGVTGGVIGVALTLPAASGLDAIAAALVGFENVVRVPQQVLVGGFVIAFVMSILGALAAGWRLQRLAILEQLE